MEIKNTGCPWDGCGTSLEITGCRFLLAPMSNDYIDIIIGAITKTNTKKVWSKTDKTSTVYRGKRIHVIDIVKAAFVNAYRDDVHMTSEFTFSKGCPGDISGDSYLSEDDILLNNCNEKFKVTGKIALYPLGCEDYMQNIIDVVNLSKDFQIYLESSHYCTIIEGDVNTIFEYFETTLKYLEEKVKHYVLQVTLSVNSPTKD